ncbi:MAG: carboxypeptidase-like regulatory domain-containing protein [Bdellovibrionota bacterium]
MSSDSSGSGLTTRSLNEDSDTSIDEELFGYDIAEGFATSGSSFSFNSRIYISFTDTDKTIPYISWIDHTGYEEVVIDFINLVNPTALTYREKTQRIYWVDQITSSKAKICSALYDGGDIQTHTTVNGAINNILINEESGKIFITETTGKKLLSLNLNSPNTTTVVKSLDSSPIAGLFNIEGSNRIIFGEEYVLKTMSTADNSIDKTIKGWTRSLDAFNIADKKIIQGFYPVSGNFVGNVYKYEESVYNIPYFYTVLKHRRRVSRIAYQKLYGDIFDTPHAFYVAVHDPNNQLNVQLYVIIPNKQSPLNPSVIPLRRFSSKTRITGLVDVPIPPAYSMPQPTPFPVDENGKTKISGKLTNFDSEEDEIPASGVSVYAEKQDSQDTNELNQGLSDDLGHYSTISDENGLFNIEDVAPGKYKLYFQKEDLSFMTNEISFDTSTDTLNTVRASQVDLEGTNCRKKDKTALMLSIESSIASAAKQALEMASSKFESSKYQNNLTDQSELLKDLYAELTEAGRNLPKVELVCKKTTTCEKVTFKNERKTFTKKVKAIKKNASKLLLTALKGQSSKKVKRNSLAKLNKKTKTALKKLKKISRKTYSCNTNEDQENL